MSAPFNIRWIWFAVCFAAFVVIQFQFLEADPSPDISTSRGPFTDEGLNTCQARNYVNHGRWGVTECDNLVKSPAFNLYMAGAFDLFDSSRKTARLAVLLGSLLLFLLFSLTLRKPIISISLLVIGGIHYQVFQFFHFAMVEILATQMILWSIASGFLFLHKIRAGERGATQWFVLHFLGLFTVTCLKVQFIYLMIFPLILVLITGRKKSIRRFTFLLAGLYVLTLLTYMYGWYFRVQPDFDRVLAGQVMQRYSGEWVWLKALKGNAETFLFRPENLILQLFFWLSFVWVIRNRKRLGGEEKQLFWVAGIWVLLEYHKVFIQWVPTRYTLSLVIAIAFWCAIFTYVGIINSGRMLKRTVIVLLMTLGVFHGAGLYRLVSERTFCAQQIINDFSHIDFKGKTVAGTWAAGLIWNESAYVVPVWNDFTPMKNFMSAYGPVLVVVEQGEKDSGGAFRKQNINLAAYYSQRKQMKYGGYTLYFHSDSLLIRP